MILSGAQPRHEIVNEIYSHMVSEHLHGGIGTKAKKLIFSCRAPLIHPFTTQKITDTLLTDFKLPALVPIKDRKIVLFLSRSIGDSANGGREITNEPQVIAALEALLKKRNQGESLLVFDRRKYPTLKATVEFFRTVKAMIGPHGAAFYNSRFAPPQTIVRTRCVI